MDYDEYMKMKKRMEQDLNFAICNIERSQCDLLNIREAAGETVNKLQTEKEKLGKMLQLVYSFPSDSDCIPVGEIDVLMPSGSTVANLIARHSHSKSVDIRNTASSLTQIQKNNIMATSTLAPMEIIFLSIGEAISDKHPPVKKFLQDYKIITRAEKRKQIENWLESIDILLSQKFKEAFVSFTDKKYMSAAHAMRETLSHLEHILAPDDRIKLTDWYFEEPGLGGPTQRQRIKYSILGHSQNKIDEKDLDRIEVLSKEGRDIYTKLSVEAHRRTETWEEKHVRSYLSIAESIIEQIMVLREQFFRN